MRAVCTRGRFEGGWKQLACVCICAHTRGGSRIPFLFLSARRRKEYILARRSFIISAGRSFFSTLRQSFFCLASFFSFPPSFFQTDHPLFRTARASPPERGGNRGRERGEKPVLLCTAEILSQTRYYFSRYYPVRAFCSFCCCSRAIALVAR